MIIDQVKIKGTYVDWQQMFNSLEIELMATEKVRQQCTRQESIAIADARITLLKKVLEEAEYGMELEFELFTMQEEIESSVGSLHFAV